MALNNHLRPEFSLPEPDRSVRPPLCVTQMCVKVVCGSIMSAVGAVCFVGATLTSKRSLEGSDFYAPFFYGYTVTMSTMLIYPVYVFVKLVARKGSVTARQILRYVTVQILYR